MRADDELKNFWKDKEKVKKAEAEILRKEKEEHIKNSFTKNWKEKNNSIKYCNS